MKKIGIVTKNDNFANKKASEFKNWLAKQNCIVVDKEDEEYAPSDLFCVFIFGGDGTFLRAAKWIDVNPIPLIGVKFGEVGFLADTTEKTFLDAAKKILNNEFSIEKRMRLKVEIFKNNKIITKKIVLNDFVINKGNHSSLISIATHIDKNFLTNYKCDGLIIATPTGSTAYSLAAGGTIVHPKLPAFLISPICPFTLTNRPLILPNSVKIEVQLDGKKDVNALAMFDGQETLEINNKNRIRISKSKYFVNMIKMSDYDYFSVIKQKLRWGGENKI